MQQATVNLFADMGVAAGDAAGRASSPPAASTDTRRRPRRSPSPRNGATVVERRARHDHRHGDRRRRRRRRRRRGVGRRRRRPGIPPAAADWSYTLDAGAVSGAVTIRSRAVDDSGNLGPPSAPIGAPSRVHGCRRRAKVPAGRSWSITTRPIRSAATTPRSCAPKVSTPSTSPTSADVTPRATLAAYDVVILGEMPSERGAGRRC